MAASASNVTAKSQSMNGKKYTVVSFATDQKAPSGMPYTLSGYINSQNMVEKVQTAYEDAAGNSYMFGDILVEQTYADYKDFGGVKFPTRIVQKQAGSSVLDLTITDVKPNVGGAIEVPANVQQAAAQPAAAPPVTVNTEKVADGVYFLTGGSHHSVAVEFSDHVVLYETPQTEARGMAVIEATRKAIPNKPIKYVINSHHHADHAGGIRAYVAEGIPIITHESHRKYYEEQIFKNPHSLNPDRLARMPRASTLETMKDKRVITDGNMTLEIYLMKDQPHSEGLLMMYVPKDKLLMQADAYIPRPGAPPLPMPSPYTTNLVDNITRLKLSVDRIVHIHGGTSPYSDVLAAAGRRTASTN